VASSARRKKYDELNRVPDDPTYFEEAIRAFEARVPLTDDEYESLLEDEKDFAFTVADVAQADLVSEVYEAIQEAVKDGTTLEDFKDRVGEQLEAAWGGEDPGRLETIFRTNVLGALNEGRYAVFDQPEIREARPYWRWEGIDDDRIDEECAPLLDVVLPADDPFWDDHVPPLHFNCRCTFTALDEDEAAEDGISDSAPDVDAAPGFGEPPSDKSWEPDAYDYPKGIGDELEDRLE